MTHWGASKEDWIHFDLGLGLTEDLLPVVSDPTAIISDASKMKALGKTPSLFNANDYAVGIPDWTSKRTTGKEIERWSADDRLGICIQTRLCRALDIDVDHSQAEAIAIDFTTTLGMLLPTRHRRPASAKMLLAFIVEGDLPKRSFRTEHGLVEFLGNGQQFVACGTHPSGSRYEWDGGPPDFPVVSAAQFEAAWANIVDLYALPDTAYEAGTRRRGADFHATDLTAEHLVEQGLVLAEGRDGQLFVACPWADGHSSDSGVTEACWFPAGTNGYEVGHYKCLHASCAKRTDDEFREKVGCGTSSDFETLPAVADDKAKEPPARPRFLQVNVKTGEIPALLHNVMLALENPAWFGFKVAYDTFLGEEVIGFEEGPGWRPLRDADMALMRRRLDQLGFKPVGKEIMRDAIDGVCERLRIDSAVEWLESLKWDGTPRVETFLSEVFGAEDTPYTRAVATYWWTAHAGRVLDAPVQVDMVPILLSEEGHYKTTTLQALVPSLANYTKIDLAHRDADLSRKMRGALLGEIEEMRGLQGRGGEGTKGFITTQVEEWTPKYKEKKTHYPRRLVLVGTTNDEDLFDGESGKRRWLPVRVSNSNREKARAMREQLWAEGAALYREKGVMWQGAHDLGKSEIERYMVEDMWEAAVAKWLVSIEAPHDDSHWDGSFFTTAERVARGALLLDAKNHNKAVRNRICKILRDMGFKPGFRREEGAIVRGWRHPSLDAFHKSVGMRDAENLA
jgi:hypothetical protein